MSILLLLLIKVWVPLLAGFKHLLYVLVILEQYLFIGQVHYFEEVPILLDRLRKEHCFLLPLLFIRKIFQLFELNLGLVQLALDHWSKLDQQGMY